MSIPVSIDPMGTLGGELPYVQPIMTSATTWSNEPSFGATVTGSTKSGYDSQGASWKTMDGDNKTYALFYDTTTPSDTKSGVIITLEKPVMLEKLVIRCQFEALNELHFFGGEADSEDELISQTETRGQRTLELTIPNKKKYQRFRLYCVNSTSNYTFIYDMKLTAYYKP